MSRLYLATTTLVAIALFTGCGSPGTDSGMPAKFTPGAIEQAGKAALEAAGGGRIDGDVSFLTDFGGEELDDYQAAFKPFEDATGVEVKIESTRDMASVLATRVDGGNPPDVALAGTLGLYTPIAKAGKMIDMRDVVGADALTTNFGAGAIEQITQDGKVIGLPNLSYLNSVIWYNPEAYKGPTSPKTWRELQEWASTTAASGTAPWCITLESGATSGWPGADFVDDIVLQQSGPEVHSQWAAGTIPWTDPRIKSAFETWGEIVNTPGMTAGDKSSILSTNFENGADPMFADPPQCFLHPMHVFMGAIVQSHFPDLTPGRNIDFFPTPAVNPQIGGAQSITLQALGMFNKTPQSVALAKYMATPAYGTLVAQTGRWMSANKNVDPAAYTDPFIKKANDIVGTATTTDLIANGFMPQSVVDAFWKGSTEYVQNPSDLDRILADIDRVRIESQNAR